MKTAAPAIRFVVVDVSAPLAIRPPCRVTRKLVGEMVSRDIQRSLNALAYGA